VPARERRQQRRDLHRLGERHDHARYGGDDRIVGLGYTGTWQSAKLGLQQSAVATTLDQQKRMSHLGIVAAWIHPKGIKHGSDFDHLDDLPGVEDGVTVPATPSVRRTTSRSSSSPASG